MRRKIEINEKAAIEQKEDGECVIKQNFNKTVDIMKKMFIKSLVMIDEDINNTAMQVIEENIMNNVMWIKKDRSYKKHIDIYSIVALIFFHNALSSFNPNIAPVQGCFLSYYKKIPPSILLL